MRFRKIKHPDYNWHGFYIGDDGQNSIVVIPYGNNIFSYLEIVAKEVKKQAENLQEKDINIYIDTLHISGNDDKTIYRISYKKEKRQIDWLSGEEISFFDTPEYLQKEIKNVYKKRKKQFEKLFLSSGMQKLSELLVS